MSYQRHRLELWTKQDGKCCYCKQQMWIFGVHKKGNKHRQATIEHIIPKSLGGLETEKSNMACSCRQCNINRDIIDHETFKWIRRQKKWSELAARARNEAKENRKRLTKKQMLRRKNLQMVSKYRKKTILPKLL